MINRKTYIPITRNNRIRAELISRSKPSNFITSDDLNKEISINKKRNKQYKSFKIHGTDIVFNPTSIAAKSTAEISALVEGLSASDLTKDIFTEESYNSSLNFVRNTNFWGKDIIGITGISPWNSRADFKRAGTAITPRHVLFCEHSNFHLSRGHKIYFVTRDNTLVTREVKEQIDHPADGTNLGDFNIAVLDEDLPDTIEVLKVLPEDALNYYEEVATYGAFDPPAGEPFYAFWVDQEEKGLIKQIGQIETLYSGTEHEVTKINFSFTTGTPVEDWWEAAIMHDSGSPAFILLNNEAILVTVTTGPTWGNGTFISTPKMINDLNNMIASVDALAGINTGHTLTQFKLDPREYKRYN